MKKLKCPNYMERKGQATVGVKCKCCGCYVQEMFPASNKPLHVTKTNDTERQYWPVKLHPTSVFVHVNIHCKDGTVWQTPLCRECASHLDQETMQELINADTQDFKRDPKCDKGFLDFCCSLVPESAEIEEVA